jgi:hypothetical protein
VIACYAMSLQLPCRAATTSLRTASSCFCCIHVPSGAATLLTARYRIFFTARLIDCMPCLGDRAAQQMQVQQLLPQ